MEDDMKNKKTDNAIQRWITRDCKFARHARQRYPIQTVKGWLKAHGRQSGAVPLSVVSGVC